MRVLAVATGARAGARPPRTPDRVAGFLAALGAAGPVDLLVVHDEGTAPAARSRAGRSLVGASGPRRVLEVVAPRLPEASSLLAVHRHEGGRPELEARRQAWFRDADRFVAAGPDNGPDIVWCADTAALTRAGWLRRSLPSALDVDRDTDLRRFPARRSARRAGATAHVVTIVDPDAFEALALPGSTVLDPADGRVVALVAEAVERAAAYRPVRT